MNETLIKILSENLNYTYNYPIYVFKNKEIQFSYSKIEDLPYDIENELLNSEITPNYIISKQSKSHYAFIKIDDEYSVIIGPIFPENIKNDNIRLLSLETGIKYDEKFKNYANLLPKLSFNDFFKVLFFVNFLFTGKNVDLLEHFSFFKDKTNEKIDNLIINNEINSYDDKTIHGTYLFEQQLIDYVKNGDVGKLKEFVIGYAKSTKINEGKLSDDPIRQAKNIFNGLVNEIGKFAAIPAGLDIEETYKIIDTYIMLCEKTEDLEKIKVLQFNMLLDFANRIHNNKVTSKVSKDVAYIIDYINAHIQDKLTINVIAEGVNSSKTTITKKFKEETGLTINDYIINKRIEVAKNMLKHTTHSILYISDFLSFSSQSYFQNCFKKFVNMTPLEYRKNNSNKYDIRH